MVAVVCGPRRRARRPGLFRREFRERTVEDRRVEPFYHLLFLISSSDSRDRARACSARRLQSASVSSAFVSGSRAGELGAGEWRARDGHHVASHGCARGRGGYRWAARSRNRRQRQRTDVVSQAGAALRRANHGAASANRRGQCAAAKNGYRARQLFRAQKAGGRADRLVRAVTHPYPGAFCFVNGRKLLVWEAKIGAENGTTGAPGRVVRVADDGAIEVAAGEGSVIVELAQFEGGAEGVAREALSGTARGADTIQFD